MSLISSLGIGTKAIAASQLAIDITGQNISNANTEGYSRKRVEVFAENRHDRELGDMGTGVEIGSVERIRNQFLDKEMNLRAGEKGYYDQLDDVYTRIENVFNEPSDNSLSKSMSDFWNAWHDLSNNPRDLSSRQTVVATSEVMTSQFHNVATELKQARLGINDDIDAHVKLINQYVHDIKQLNDEVATAEAGPKANANDSRDRRQVVLKKLAGEVGIDWFEDDQGRITVTASGTILLSPNITNDLELYRNSVTESDGSISSSVGVRFGMNKQALAPKDGTLKSLFDARDTVIPKFEDKLNTIASTMVSSINEVHQTGYTLNGATGVSFFDPENTQAANISLSEAVLADPNNIAAGKGGKISSPVGGPVAATLGASIPSDIDLKLTNSQYYNLKQNSVVIKKGAETLQEGAGKDYLVNYQTGVITFINSAYLNPGDNVTIDFQYNDGGAAGKGDGSNASAIANLKDAALTQPNALGENTQSVGEFYSSFIGVLGIERNQVKSEADTRTFVLDQLEKRQAEVSGVSMDEEMANMIKFEHSYQAAAKYMSMVGQMMDAIMNIG